MMENSDSESEEMEVDDSLEEEYGPLHKRPNLMMDNIDLKSLSEKIAAERKNQQSLGTEDFDRLLDWPLDGPPPLGLKLPRTPSFMKEFERLLNQSAKESKDGAASGDHCKASNFNASFLKIGSWEYKPRNEGELVAKFYYAKQRLVWEFLDGGKLSKQPLFFIREINPQSRRNTLWQATSDFTGGEATKHRRHYLECPHFPLGKHIDKLAESDPRSNELSKFPWEEINLDSPFFETDDEDALSIYSESDPSETPSPSSCEAPSPSSARNTLTVEDIKNGRVEQLKDPNNWDHIEAPGLTTSMSMTDLVSHLENLISEQGTSNDLSTLSSEDQQSLQMLDDIRRCLFSDTQDSPAPDDKSLMSWVNSLCCLLQQDTDMQYKSDVGESSGFGGSEGGKESDDICGFNQLYDMSRKDSFGDLLLNVSRMASLPQFLFKISDNFECQS
ncbi:hypothetical protein BUALT_Bualt02G0101600 [Buddleja alternifolia]|uniref:TRF2/HOY1 PH-like domain-containing protein n=1 Tax=Buddleja alternifolia TaxID=168488 RepID=A0AAV6XZ37_9LAMI|nr:hypothetical protein BUALT_Bualt02G0101600 [Buddleja alternifolia]